MGTSFTKTLFSFGNWKYYDTLDHLEDSTKNFGNVDNIRILKESDIDTSFYIKNYKHFLDNRGFGYWVWKSYFIDKFLKTAKDNDVFLYADSGNLVENDLTPLFDACWNDKKGIILFENADGEPNGEIWKNNLWTKSDCFNLLGLTSNEYLYGNQVNASYIVFRKTDFSLKFFDVYLKASQNYNIISDAPNITNDLNKDFRDHRHDQSILSLLSIRYKITILRDPSQWGNHRITNDSTYKQLFFHHRRKYYPV
jgi:hypothetical protein